MGGWWKSSPGPDGLHSHKRDIGHPDNFERNARCVGKGFSKGAINIAASDTHNFLVLLAVEETVRVKQNS